MPAAAPPQAPLSHADPSFDALLRAAEIHRGHDGADLREMGKFTESPNVYGLAAHTVERPIGDSVLAEMGGTIAEPAVSAQGVHIQRLLRDLARGIRRAPMLAVESRFGAACARPLRCAALFPQSHAHLAAAWLALSAAEPPAAGRPVPPSFWAFFDPEAEERKLVYIPESNLVLILGCDDIRPALFAALEHAHRGWLRRNRQIAAARSGGGASPPEAEDILVLPGGSFPAFPAGPECGGAPEAILHFAGESAPDEWERTLAASDGLSGAGPASIRAASAEPWVAEGGGWISPFFASPFLPARLAAADPAWLEAALDPDALPFGAAISHRGDLDYAASPEDAFVIVPRRRVPPPFERSPFRRVKAGRVVTHRSAKNEAMELWARGFPAAEVVAPGGAAAAQGEH